MKNLKERELVYIIDEKVFYDFDKATEYSDKNPDKKLYRTLVSSEIKNYERIVTTKDRIPKEGIPFTDDEYNYIKEQLKDEPYLVILNKIDYHGRNYLYIYQNTPTYSAAFVNLYKYKNSLYALDRANIKFNNIDEFIYYCKKKNKYEL